MTGSKVLPIADGTLRLFFGFRARSLFYSYGTICPVEPNLVNSWSSFLATFTVSFSLASITRIIASTLAISSAYALSSDSCCISLSSFVKINVLYCESNSFSVSISICLPLFSFFFYFVNKMISFMFLHRSSTSIAPLWDSVYFSSSSFALSLSFFNLIESC